MCSSISDALGGIPVEVEGIVSSSWSRLDAITEPPREPPKRRGVRGKIPTQKARRKSVDQVSDRSFSQQLKDDRFDDGLLPF